MEYKDRTKALMVIGALLLIVGLFSAFLGPIEMYPFYMFSEGGRFHYLGFGFGSFMFGNIAAQVAGYYLIAMILIPLGYGHLRLRSWSRTLFLVLLECWLVLGIPLTIVFLFMLFSVKQLSMISGMFVVLATILGYTVIPLILIRFYQGDNVRHTFKYRDPNEYWTEHIPIPVQVLATLFVFYALVLHAPIFFNGILPFFGRWLSELQGIFILDILILFVIWLAWGILRQKALAWWGGLIFLSLMTVTTLVTLITSSYAEMLAVMDLPPTEMEILSGMPIQGMHIAAFICVPLVATLGILIFSRRYFG